MLELKMESEIVCKRNLSIRGLSCERAGNCDWATDACRTTVLASSMVCDPTKRWMYCYAYKQKLGMVFDKDLGVYILPEWKEELIRRLKE